MAEGVTAIDLKNLIEDRNVLLARLPTGERRV